jgi:hypothetical protein
MLWTFLFVLAVCFVFTGVAMAQVDQGAITGVVKDSTGAVIPRALVTLTNTDTNFVLQDKTDAKGEYVFSPIKIGHYKVSATAPKFEVTTQENITLNIQDRLSITITLKPGAVTESVTVTAAPPLLQTATSSVGQVMNTETINNTPLNGRNWIYVAQLTAGVAPAVGADTIARGGGTGDFMANGQRTTQNNFIIDGVDNNVSADDLMNGASYNVRPPPDALAEFKIDTSNYSAEFGHSAGAVLSASIKSGTNQIHGDLWEYVRNTDLDALDWNEKPPWTSTATNPPYHENQFGATLGLPFWKNKVFYFGDAEANRIDYSVPWTGNVPTASVVNGDFSELFETSLTGNSAPLGMFAPNTDGQLPLTCGKTTAAFPNPGGVTVTALNGDPTTNVLCPGQPYIFAPGSGPWTSSGPYMSGGSSTGQIDAVGQEVLAAYPHPNIGGWTSSNLSTPGSGRTYNNYAITAASKDDTWQWDQRMDVNITAKDQTYFRFSYTHDQVTNTPPLGHIIDGSNQGPNGFNGSNDFNLARNFMISETHLFTPKLINEFRFGYNWGNYWFLQANGNVPASTLIPGMNDVPFTGTAEPNGGLPWMIFGGSYGINQAGGHHDIPSIERQNIYQILDNVTNVWRSHSIKLGVELQSLRASFAQAFSPRGLYQYGGGYTSKYGVGTTGGGPADLLTGNSNKFRFSPDWNTSYYRWYRAAYAQDDWKFNSKLTINLGVRYDYVQPYSNVWGGIANFQPTSMGINASGVGYGSGIYQMSYAIEGDNLLPPAFVADLADQNITVDYLNNKTLAQAQKGNFAPRVGFAYRVDPKTVIRTAYGMFYGGIEVPGGSEPTVNYPFAYTSVFTNNFEGGYACYPSIYSGATNLSSLCPSVQVPNTTNLPFMPYPAAIEYGLINYSNNGAPSGIAPGVASYASGTNINRYNYNIKTPYTESYNLTIERQLSQNMVGTVAYVGNVARHTYTNDDFGSNLALTNSENYTPTVPYPAFGWYPSAYVGEQMYNSVQAKLEKRYSKGLSYLASYTFSHAEDSGCNPGIGPGPYQYRNTNIIPLKDEITNSVLDTRQRLTLNGYYDLPFGKGRKWVNQGGAMDYIVGGWSASLTFQAQTGIPFNVTPSGAVWAGANGIQNSFAIKVSNPFAGGGLPPAANVDMGGQTCPSTVKNRANWFNPCAFIDPLSGMSSAQAGTPQNGPGIPMSGPGSDVTGVAQGIAYMGSKQNQIYGPGFERVNMSLFKNFKTWHAQYIQFRADAFNVLNHPTNNLPSVTSLKPNGGLINSFDALQNYAPDARFFQLAGKYVF